MKLNVLTASAVLAGAVATSVLVADSASAFVIGESGISDAGGNGLEEVGITTTFSFNGPFSGSGLFTSGVLAPFDSVVVNSLTLQDTGLNDGAGDIYELSMAAAPWKTYTDTVSGLTADFFITSGRWLRNNGPTINYSSLGRFQGFYNFSDGRSYNGFGTLDITKAAQGNVSFEMSQDVEAIPTPALLPGLIGMGVAALRRRKGDDSEAAAADV
jgi:hypothetical protein